MSNHNWQNQSKFRSFELKRMRISTISWWCVKWIRLCLSFLLSFFFFFFSFIIMFYFFRRKYNQLFSIVRSGDAKWMRNRSKTWKSKTWHLFSFKRLHYRATVVYALSSWVVVVACLPMKSIRRRTIVVVFVWLRRRRWQLCGQMTKFSSHSIRTSTVKGWL